MKQPAGSDRHNPSPDPSSSSRRKFLKASAAAAALAAVGAPIDVMRRVASAKPRMGAANTMPGRIVLYHDPAMDGHSQSIDMFRVEEVVHHAIQILTERADTARAFESLFPGLYSTSKIAIKVNTLGSCDTRWEVARGIVSGLSTMLGGTYDISNVTIFDRDAVAWGGWLDENFTFNGKTAYLASGNNASGSGHYIYGKELSRYILETDYLIDVPAFKSHSDPQNQITIAMKNHYGSCTPSNLCGNIPGMLTLNADANIKDKTALVLTSAIWGTWTGGPSTPPQNWNTFTEGTPNMIFASTDPVTNDYWAREIINAERATHSGYSQKPCPWIETASDAPYELGVSDPELMTVLNLDATDAQEGEALVGGTFLAPNVPNPFRERTDLHFRLEEAGNASMRIIDASGRAVCDLGAREYTQGYHAIPWDGRDGQGRPVSAGVYFAELVTRRARRTRRVILAR